jgi:hypothetical protein
VFLENFFEELQRKVPAVNAVNRPQSLVFCHVRPAPGNAAKHCPHTWHARIVRLGQSPLFDHDFHTARPARLVYCHQEFLDKLSPARRACGQANLPPDAEDGCGHRPPALQRNQR